EVDDDCDGTVDGPDPIDGVTWWSDADADGWGGVEETGCEAPADPPAEGGDCDDEAPDVNPAAEEQCNGVDDDCDEEVDEGCEQIPGDIQNSRVPPEAEDLVGDNVGCSCATPVGLAPGWPL